jgi:hypothetical protein
MRTTFDTTRGRPSAGGDEGIAMTQDEIVDYLTKRYSRDVQNPDAPSRFTTIKAATRDGCVGYEIDFSNAASARCTSFVSADVSEAELDVLMSAR